MLRMYKCHIGKTRRGMVKEWSDLCFDYLHECDVLWEVHLFIFWQLKKAHTLLPSFGGEHIGSLCTSTEQI